MLMQFDFPLSGEHGVFYDAGIAGDWGFAFGVQRREANTGRGAEVLQEGDGALRAGIAIVRAGGARGRARRRVHGGDGDGEWNGGKVSREEGGGGDGVLRFTE